MVIREGSPRKLSLRWGRSGIGTVSSFVHCAVTLCDYTMVTSTTFRICSSPACIVRLLMPEAHSVDTKRIWAGDAGDDDEETSDLDAVNIFWGGEGSVRSKEPMLPFDCAAYSRGGAERHRGR